MEDTIQSIVHDFTRILSSEDDSLTAGVPDLLAYVEKELGRKGLCGAGIHAAELRILLNRLADKSTHNFQEMVCGRVLLHFGLPGRYDALKIFSSSRWLEQEVIAFLDGMNSTHTLLLLHHILAHGNLEERNLQEWVKKTLKNVPEMAPTSVYAFCVQLGRDGELPAFVVLKFLKQGRILSWFEDFFSKPLPAAELERVVYAVSVLDEPGLLCALASHLSELSEDEVVHFCRVAADHFPHGDTQIIEILCKMIPSLGDPSLFACLRCVFSLQWPKAGVLLNLLLRKRPDLVQELQRIALLLPHPQFCSLYESRQLEAQNVVVDDMLQAAVSIDADFVRTLCVSPEDAGITSPVCDLLRACVPAGSVTESIPFPDTSEPDPPVDSGHSLLGGITSLFFKKKVPLGEALHTYASLEDCSYDGSRLEDRMIAKCIVKRVQFRSVVIKRVVFDRIRFLACDFSKAMFLTCEFKECSFSECRFEKARCVDSTVEKCHFEKMNGHGFALGKCLLVHNLWTSCILTGALFDDSGFHCDKFCASSLAASQWTECSLTSCRFEGIDLYQALFLSCSWRGVVTKNVRFEKTGFVALTVCNVTMRGVMLQGCLFEDFNGMEPTFLQAALEYVFWNTTLETMPPAQNVTGVSTFDARIFFKRWRWWMVMCATEARMVANNQRRLAWATEKLATGQDVFFQVLPCLFHSTRFDEYTEMRGVPPCRILDFEPTYTQLGILDTMFPYIKERSRSGVHGDVLDIAALYTIGSLGTVAQNSTSDVDVWVCLKDKAVDPVRRSRLVAKCDALSVWAKEEYDLDLHFFVMTLDEIRSNNFGILSDEGSGSAQALLLKEEFYRTALLIAGREPLWWLLPSWYDEARRQLPGSCYPKERCCDLGKLQEIPKDEFFGASLWQIVNSAKNPYKSLLKLALLEKYAMQGATSRTLLSEVIKKNLFHKKREVYDIDPYALLYKELLVLYGKLDDKDAIRLLQESFHFKVRMQDIDLSLGFPQRQEEQSVLFFYFQSRVISEDMIRKLGKKWTIAKTLEMGKAMNTFMLGTYGRIRNLVSAAGNDVSIHPREMTTLGRTISAFFSQEPGKILRIFFLGQEETDYQELYFFCEKDMNGSKRFAARGRRHGESRVLEHLEVVHLEKAPMNLAAWLVINGLFSPGVLVSGNSSLAPVSVSYLQGLLHGILKIFPPDTTFTVLQEDLLEEKMIKKILCVFTKSTEKDERKVHHVDILYLTTWGELFCTSVVHPPQSVRTDPSGFFTRVLPYPLDWEAEFFQFRPSSGNTVALDF